MEHSAQGSTETGTPVSPQGDRRARVPVQSRAGSAGPAGPVASAGAARSAGPVESAGYGEYGDRGEREWCGPAGAARGEHTHGETSAPAPAPVSASAPDPAPGPVPAQAPVPVPAPVSAPAPASVLGLASEGGPSPQQPRAVVQRASVRGQILDALRTALATGELLPGEVYSAPVLGERFGVSATPVREAMQQLALEGAVEVVPNRGFRVIVRGARELAELAEVRALLEVPVLMRLARTVPAERWAELRPLAEASVRAAATGCRATYAEADRVFHRAVLALSGNEQLVGIAEDLHRRSQWPLVGGPAGRCRAALVADAAEHMSLLEALTAGEPDVVQALMREHFVGAGG
ncbi:DNA-binding GntR family transcriptional regulator [Streptomyces achromogenes]|uniref:GntR family transcriptional regulator n=1 Tax=Streptomyces achromogenes TaxID=67255 RepID=UPI00278888A9|nr:GntR family transcriptional regulator [Streptomyces achromogenes]MDQ0834191.1 DNA-binding GntR family transcriptional regulator [Streptomyces achromogenes]